MDSLIRESMAVFSLFKAQIQELADLLEGVFDDTVIDVAQLKVDVLPPPPQSFIAGWQISILPASLD